jgi:putative heme transporter
VPASDKTTASDERSDSRTRGAGVASNIASDPTDADAKQTPNGSQPRASIDLDPRSAIPLAVAFGVLAISVWFVRSIPRTLTAAAIATLLALALNPLVEALRRRTGWQRKTAAAVVLVTFGVIAVSVVALVTVPTIREVRDFKKQIPRTVRDLGDLPVVGSRLRDAHASAKVQRWLDEAPRRLSISSTPLEHAAGTVADGIAAGLFTVMLAVTLLLDGEQLVRRGRRLVPARHRDDADKLGRLVYEVIGRYIAGSVFVALLAGVVMLTSSLVLGVPLAPLVAVWVAITNPIPQIGGFLGGAVFVLLGATQGAVVAVACILIFLTYQQIENHVLQPLIIGRAVHLSPPSTMVAALVGVSAGGVVGALFAVPLLGATKAIYMATRQSSSEIVGQRK